MVVRRRAPHNGRGGDGFSGCRLNDRSTVVRSRCPGRVRGGLYFCLSTIKPQSSTGAVKCGRGRLRWRAVYKSSHHPPTTHIHRGGSRRRSTGETESVWQDAAHSCWLARIPQGRPYLGLSLPGERNPHSPFLQLSCSYPLTSRLKIYQIEILMKNLNQSKIQSCLCRGVCVPFCFSHEHQKLWQK